MNIYIAAPFGNYIKPKQSNVIPVIGTYTLERRRGLLWKLLTTLRYDSKDKCWYNSLGLRNPGLAHGIDKITHGEVLSVAAINPTDYDRLNAQIPLDVPLELNISCPNINHFQDYLKGIGQFQPRNPILKLSPHMKQEVLDYLIDQGFTTFHASNTYKTDKGARSGKFLEPYTIMTLEYLKSQLGEDRRLIAGGGITHLTDIETYMNAGADAFSLGTVCFNPYRLHKLLSALDVT